AAVPRQPRDGHGIPLRGDEVAAPRADRPERMVVHLAAGGDRREGIEQADHVADEPGLGLAPLAEEDDVVAGQDAPLERGQHGIVEPHDGWEQRLASSQALQEVLSKLVLHGPVGEARGAEFAEGGRSDVVCHGSRVATGAPSAAGALSSPTIAPLSAPCRNRGGALRVLVTWTGPR